MPASSTKLQEVITTIRDLRKAADQTAPQIDQLALVLEHLLKQSGSGQVLSSTIVVLDQLLAIVGQLSPAWYSVEIAARQASMAMEGAGAAAVRGQAGLGVPSPAPTARLPQVKMTGAFDLPALAQEQPQLAASRIIAMDQMIEKYAAMGYKLEDVKTKLDATNQAWEIQATIIGKVSGAFEAVSSAQERYSAVTGKEIDPNALVGDLQARMGPRFDEFKKHIEDMGFSMRDLNSVQEDAVNGITRFSFSAAESSGATKSASFHIDKLGRALGDTSTRFKAFDDMLYRNIEKVTQWAIAVGLVFGAWQKFQQLMQDMTTIQDQMVDLAIVTGQSMDQMEDDFRTVAGVAREVGVDISETMDAMSIAMRATGGLEGETRTTTATELLGDATAYAKLSGIGMSDAIDILVSSLRQMNMPLDQSEQLLNKWVAVSRLSHTSLLDLGKAFATTAAAAEGVGVNVDDLNGLIATMAEVTNLSSQQSANAIRALFSSVQMPQAQAALGKYGIAVTDINGEMRDLMPILEDINKLMTDFGDGAILGKDAVNELAYALGGQGARRAAQMTALLENLNRVFGVSAVSTAAQGELEAALAMKGATLQTSITKLSNSFKVLAVSLGGAGGMLEFLTSTVEVLDWITLAISDLTQVLGPATTAIMGFAVAWQMSEKFAVPTRISNLATGMLGRAAALESAGKQRPANIMFGAAQATEQFGPSAMYGITAGIMAGMASGDATRGIGTGIGTAIGFYLGGPAGAMIGSVIGDSFVTVAKDIGSIWAQDLGIEKRPVAGEMDREEILEELKTRVLGPGIMGGAQEFMQRQFLFDREMSDEELMRKMVTSRMEELGPRYQYPPEIAARIEELIAALDHLADVEEQTAKEGIDALAPEMQVRFRSYQRQHIPDLRAEYAQRRQEMPFELAKGDIQSISEYNAELERMSALLDYSILPIFDVYVQSMEKNGQEIGNQKQLFQALGIEMAQWNDESVNFILEQANVIIQLQDEYKELSRIISEDLTDATERASLGGRRSQVAMDLQERLGMFGPMTEQMRETQRIESFLPIPSFTEYRDMSKQEFESVLAEAYAFQIELGEYLSIPPEVFQSLDDWHVRLVDEGGDALMTISGLHKQAFDAMLQDHEELKNKQEETFNVRRLKDIDPGKMGEIEQANRYWVEYLSRIRGQSAQEYLEMEGQEFNLILGPGNVLQKLYSTNEAMAFTLQDILETEEKQLEGMWNIPSGATWFVPITSLFYQKGEGGGFPDLAPLIPPTEQTAGATTDTAIGIHDLNATQLQMLKKMTRPEYDAAVKKMEATGGEPPNWLHQMMKKAFPSFQETRPEIGEALPTPKRDIDLPEMWLPTIMRELTTTQASKAPGLQAPINVEMPPIEATNNLNIQVALDGAMLYRQITKIISRFLTRSIRSNGKITFGTVR